MSQTVADVLVGVLEEIGVKHIFGLIGDSLNPLADAVRRSDIEWVGVRHEEGAALAAAGQAKLTGRLAVCAGTTGPGSTHLVAGLYEASRDHAPVLALSGDMARKMHGIDFIPDNRARFVVPRRLALHPNRHRRRRRRRPSSIRPSPRPMRARRRASDAAAGCDRRKGGRSRFQRGDLEAAIRNLRQATPTSPTSRRRLDAAGSVVIMCGAGCHGAAEELRALSDRLKAPLIHSVKGKDIMPYDDPHWMGGIGMIGTKAVYNAVMHCDLLLMLGTDYPYSEFLPSKGAVIQIDERPEVLGRRAPTVLGVVGSVRPTLKLLLDKVAAKSDAQVLGPGHQGAPQMG